MFFFFSGSQFIHPRPVAPFNSVEGRYIGGGGTQIRSEAHIHANILTRVAELSVWYSDTQTPGDTE